MNSYNQNAIPELVDLAARLAQADQPEGGEVRVELRVHPATVDGPDDVSISVSLKRLILSLKLHGLHAVPGSRFGEPTRENEEVRELTMSAERSVENKVSGEAGIKAALMNPELSLKGSGSRAVKTKNTVSYSEKSRHYNVRALGNLIWEVTQPPWEEDQRLDLTYLNDNAICKVAAQDRANQKSVHLTSYSKQKDIVVQATKPGFNLLRHINQKKLLNILIAKALSTEGQFNGTVTFSESVIDLEN
jgi:hypothetical protein